MADDGDGDGPHPYEPAPAAAKPESGHNIRIFGHTFFHHLLGLLAGFFGSLNINLGYMFGRIGQHNHLVRLHFGKAATNGKILFLAIWMRTTTSPKASVVSSGVWLGKIPMRPSDCRADLPHRPCH
jgi:hypothetical protein